MSTKTVATTTKKSAKEIKAQLALQKLLVGHYIEKASEDDKKKIVYVWQGDGIWEIRRLKLGTFITHIEKFKTPGLESNLTAGWTLNVPKIPAACLDMTLSFFRSIYDEHASEVFIQYFYDTKKEEYLLNCPKQDISGSSVNYTNDKNLEGPDKILVFEIHSHVDMPAFFSTTDDKDEKDDRFFGVIGKVKQYYPELKLRMSVGGRMAAVKLEDLFSLDESAFHEKSFPQEWIENIKKRQVKKSTVSAVQRHRRYGGPGSRYQGRVFYPSRQNEEIYPGAGRFPPHSTYDKEEQGDLFGEEIKPLSSWGESLDMTDEEFEQYMEYYSTEEVKPHVPVIREDYKQIGDRYFRVVEVDNRIVSREELVEYFPGDEDGESCADKHDKVKQGQADRHDKEREQEGHIRGWQDIDF
jgi:PRTRC genetic system protein A